MGCFTFPLGLKRDEPKTTKLLSIHSSDSALTDREVNRSASDLRSQNVSNTSSESSVRRNSFPSTSQRATNLRVFSFQELKSATKGFSRSVNIGEGGFGCVFKAALRSLEDPSKKIEVAIKQLGKRGLQGHREWVNEVNVLGIVEHQNLVKLLGYCADDDERGMQRLLVYEYMPNGSVEDHLSPRSQTTLSWPMRLKIAQDAARGLAYLHEQMDFQIIFRDFKSSNILLDEHWNAKLSDFGLARLGPEEGSTHVSTAVVGTLGYAAPEYIRTGRLTAKSDVWGYGVFLYELITGRRPLDKSRPKSEQNLLDWVKPYISDLKRFQLIVDPRLEGKYPIKSVHRLSRIANQCLDRRHRSRPKMSVILDLVNEVIEASGELGSPRLIVRKLVVSKETSEEKQVKKRNMDAKSGEDGWFARMLKRRILKAR